MRKETIGRKEKHDGRNSLGSSSDDERIKRKIQTEDISSSHKVCALKGNAKFMSSSFELQIHV